MAKLMASCIYQKNEDRAINQQTKNGKGTGSNNSISYSFHNMTNNKNIGIMQPIYSKTHYEIPIPTNPKYPELPLNKQVILLSEQKSEINKTIADQSKDPKLYTLLSQPNLSSVQCDGKAMKNEENKNQNIADTHSGTIGKESCSDVSSSELGNESVRSTTAEDSHLITTTAHFTTNQLVPQRSEENEDEDNNQNSKKDNNSLISYSFHDMPNKKNIGIIEPIYHEPIYELPIITNPKYTNLPISKRVELLSEQQSKISKAIADESKNSNVYAPTPKPIKSSIHCDGKSLRKKENENQNKSENRSKKYNTNDGKFKENTDIVDLPLLIPRGSLRASPPQVSSTSIEPDLIRDINDSTDIGPYCCYEPQQSLIETKVEKGKAVKGIKFKGKSNNKTYGNDNKRKRDSKDEGAFKQRKTKKSILYNYRKFLERIHNERDLMKQKIEDDIREIVADTSTDTVSVRPLIPQEDYNVEYIEVTDINEPSTSRGVVVYKYNNSYKETFACSICLKIFHKIVYQDHWDICSKENDDLF